MSTDSYSTYKKFKPSELRRDTRDFFEKYHSKMTSNVDGIKYVWGLIGFVGFVCVFLPLGNVVFAILIYFILNKYTRPNDYFFEFPWRAPQHSNAMDASIDITKSVPDDIKKKPKSFLGVCTAQSPQNAWRWLYLSWSLLGNRITSLFI